MSEIIKKKISDASIPEVETLSGFKVLGINSSNESVKADLGLVNQAKVAANAAATLANDAATSANNAAGIANTAADNADTKAGLANDAATLANSKAALADEKATLADQKATLANDAATSANNAAGTANTAADNADAKTAELEAVRILLEAQWVRPTAMELDYPRTITLRNTVQKQIAVTLTPAGDYKNMLFIDDDNAIKVLPDGSIFVKQTGNSKVHVIPTDNTALYKTIDITIVEPGIRNISASSMRFTGSGNLRLT